MSEEKSMLHDFFILILLVAAIGAGAFLSHARNNTSTASMSGASLVPTPSVRGSGNAYLLPSNSTNNYPMRNWSAIPPTISAQAAMVTSENEDIVYYAKNIQEQRPIASITKLMNALVVAEKLNFNDVVTMSQQAIDQTGDEGHFAVGEEVRVKDLVASMLVASSNDAAYALAQYTTDKITNQNASLSPSSLQPFFDAMNAKAAQLGLSNTHFASATGLEDENNYSTAQELGILIKTVRANPLLAPYIDLPDFSFTSVNPPVSHHVVNTNKLFGALDGILATKTGYTDLAGQSLDMIYELPGGQRIIVVVLGSADRFGDAKKLIQWVEDAYRFHD